MPFALLIIGAVLLISAARGTVTTGPNGGPGLFALLESDFTGQGNFIYWFVAILFIGAIGYVPKLKPFSVAFLTLVILVLFLKKGNPSGVGGGFFSQALSGIGATQSASPSVAANSGSAASAGGSSLTSLLSAVEPSSSYTASSGVASDASMGGSSLTSLLSGAEPGSSYIAPNQAPAPLNFSVLTPSPNPSTDLSFPALGV